MPLQMTGWDGTPIPPPTYHTIDMSRDTLTTRVVAVDDDDYPPGSTLEAFRILRVALHDAWRATGIEPRIVWLLERIVRLRSR